MSAKSRSALLALTLTAGPLLIATSAQAAESTCGQPARTAVYGTVTHAFVPAVDQQSHVELGVTRSATAGPWQGSDNEGALTGVKNFHQAVTVTEHYWSQTTPGTAPTTEDSGWVLESPSGDGWVLDDHRTVVDQPYVAAVPATDEQGHLEPSVPAVYEIEYLWVQQTTGDQKWELGNWNGNSQSTGWLRTATTRNGKLLSAEVPESWVIDQAATAGTPETPAVTHPEYRYERTIAGTDPVVDFRWSVDSPGAGWADTGQTRVTVTESEYTEYEWARTVIDVAAKDAVAATTEQVLLTPAVPAGPSCPVDAVDPGVVPVTTPAVTPPAAKPAAAMSPAASAVPTTLAYTGVEAVPYASLGALLLMAGAGLSAVARRAGRKA